MPGFSGCSSVSATLWAVKGGQWSVWVRLPHLSPSPSPKSSTFGIAPSISPSGIKRWGSQRSKAMRQYGNNCTHDNGLLWQFLAIYITIPGTQHQSHSAIFVIMRSRSWMDFHHQPWISPLYTIVIVSLTFINCITRYHCCIEGSECHKVNLTSTHHRWTAWLWQASVCSQLVYHKPNEGDHHQIQQT